MKYDNSSMGIFNYYWSSKFKNTMNKIFGNDGASRAYYWAFFWPLVGVYFYIDDCLNGEEKRRIAKEEVDKIDAQKLEEFNTEFIKNRYFLFYLLNL